MSYSSRSCCHCSGTTAWCLVCGRPFGLLCTFLICALPLGPCHGTSAPGCALGLAPRSLACLMGPLRTSHLCALEGPCPPPSWLPTPTGLGPHPHPDPFPSHCHSEGRSTLCRSVAAGTCGSSRGPYGARGGRGPSAGAPFLATIPTLDPIRACLVRAVLELTAIIVVQPRSWYREPPPPEWASPRRGISGPQQLEGF